MTAASVKKEWPRVRLGEVLHRTSPAVAVRTDVEYPNFGVYSFGRGLFRKPPISGALTSASTLYRATAGQFVYSRLFAFEGAYGFVSPEFDGYYVSNEFPLFDCDLDRVVPEFIAGYVRQPHVWRSIAESATGVGHRRQRVQPGGLLAYELPLPPMAEQHRLVKRIEELSARIYQARNARDEATRQSGLLWARGASSMFDRLTETSPLRRLEQVVAIRGGGTPSKADPFYWSGSTPWITPKDMKVREVRNSIDHISERATLETAAKVIDPGAVLVVVRGMILTHTVPSAVLAVPAAINQDMKALVPNEILLSEFLCTLFWACNSRFLSLVDRSTHDTRKLQTAKLLGSPIPVPPIPEQRRIVAEVEEFRAEVDALKRLQGDATRELDVLLRTVLERAFEGKL